MIVTDKQISIDNKLLIRLDKIVDLINKEKPAKDAQLNIEGPEGEGKSTLAGICGYYIAWKTGRQFSHDNFFFDAEKLIEFAQSTHNQVIIWDEPALAGLSTEWWNESQRNLTKLMMMIRQHRHFFIFCMTKFHKFNEYFVVDRPVGMIHVYSNKRGIGNFCYIPKKNLEWIYKFYKEKKIRAYRKFMKFRSTFSDVLPKLINITKYYQAKTDAIMQIGVKKASVLMEKYRSEVQMLKYHMSLLKFPIKSRRDYCLSMGLSYELLSSWHERYEKEANSLEKPVIRSTEELKHNKSCSDSDLDSSNTPTPQENASTMAAINPTDTI